MSRNHPEGAQLAQLLPRLVRLRTMKEWLAAARTVFEADERGVFTDADLVALLEAHRPVGLGGVDAAELLPKLKSTFVGVARPRIGLTVGELQLIRSRAAGQGRTVPEWCREVIRRALAPLTGDKGVSIP